MGIFPVGKYPRRGIIDPVSNPVSKSLRAFRSAHGVTQTQVAMGMGVGQGKVSEMEHGKRRMTIDKMINYLRAVDPDCLVRIEVESLDGDRYRTTTLWEDKP